MNPLFASAASMMGRGTWGLGKLGARAAYFGATRGAALAGAAGIVAGEAAMAAGYAGYRMGGGLMRATIGANPLVVKEAQVMGRTIRYPHQFTRRAQNVIVGMGIAGAVAAGGYDALRQNSSFGWNMEQNVLTGSVEVEQPHFLGATGSLVLASAASRRGLPPPEPPGQPMNLRHMAPLADDLLIAMMRGGR